MSAVAELVPALPVRRALAVLGVSHTTWYRRRSPHAARGARRGAPPLALAAPERQLILEVLNSPRFADATPYTAWARLLDEGVYLASVRTFYRILAAAGQLCERRHQLVHPPHAKPELLATAPNQVWSWDITRLKGVVKWQYFYLYVLIDIFSRYVVGWLVAQAENAGLASALIEESCLKHGVARDTLTLHSDRGSPMRNESIGSPIRRPGSRDEESKRSRLSCAILSKFSTLIAKRCSATRPVSHFISLVSELIRTSHPSGSRPVADRS